jgi:hypothetical protein
MYELHYKQCSANSELHSMIGIMAPFVIYRVAPDNPDYFVVPCSLPHRTHDLYGQLCWYLNYIA